MTTNWYSKHADLLGKDVGKKSTAEALKKRLGQFSFADEEASVGVSNNRAKLELATRKLARSVNVLSNARQGEEVSLAIGWSDGTKANQPGDNTIWLSPADVIDERKGTRSMDVAIDALTGQSLLASTMKRTIHPDSWEQAKRDGSSPKKHSAIIWQAIETAVARNEVLDSWSGFAPYFARHEQSKCADKAEVQKALDEYKPSPELAAAAVAWNLLHPHDPVTVPASIQKCVERCLAEIGKEVPADDERYNLARRMAGYLVVEEPPPPPPPVTDDSLFGEKQKGGKEQEKSEDQPPQESKQPEPEEEPQPEQPKEDEKPEETPDSPSSDGEPEDGEPEDGEPEDGEPQNNNGDDAQAEPESNGKGDEADESGEEEPGDADLSSNPGDAEPEPQPEPEAPAEPEKPEGPAPDNITDSAMFGEAVERDGDKIVSPSELPSPAEVDQISLQDGEIGHSDGMAVCEAWLVTHCDEPDPTLYNEATAHLQTYIKAIGDALRFRNNDPTLHIRGQTSGDLDEGGLDKLSLREDQPAIWERRELHGQPKVAVGLLIDESGSMGGGKIKAARDVVVALSAALARIKGVSLMVLGHTANCSGKGKQRKESRQGFSESELAERRREVTAIPYGDVYKGSCNFWLSETLKTTERTEGKGTPHCVINEYLTVAHRNPYAIVHASAHSNNLDGFAMEYAVKKMLKDYPTHQRRILFVVSDGQPSGRANGSRYSGDPAFLHMKNVCEFARRGNIGVYGIGICNAYDNEVGAKMYGRGNFIVINDVMSSLQILTAHLKNICQRPL